jgi:pyruvate-formate lyase
MRDHTGNGILDLELRFTDAYREHLHDHVATREAACLQVLWPAIFGDIQDGDLFAGRITTYPNVGLGLELASGGPFYYCNTEKIQQLIEQADTGVEMAVSVRHGDRWIQKPVNREDLDASTRKRIEDMLAFWEKERTIRGKLIRMLPEDVKEGTTNRIASMGGRLAGPMLDFEKLARVGLPGLAREVAACREQAESAGRGVEIYDGMQVALELLVDTCRRYAGQAREHAESAPEEHKAELLEMARVLEKIAHSPPETYREAAQLHWLYALISGVANYGRLDVALGEFYARDVDSGTLTEEQALALTQSLWQLIADRQIFYNSRVVVGGIGRPNEEAADRFALLAMEATRTVLETEPQLTLRFYQGMNPTLMAKALDVIGEGRTYPILYNDDVNVPAVVNAFRVSREEAEQYLPYGCGEYTLNHLSVGSPNCSFNMLKALEATLHNGRDALSGEPLGLALGDFASFEAFDRLFAAYKRQAEAHIEFLARRHALEYVAERESAALLYVTMLYDHCMERGRSVVDRGPRYTGGIIESFGLVNVADSLTAIKKLVYDEKQLTQEQLLAALDADFEEFEREYRWMLDVPKYGNDDDEADAMVQAVSDHAVRYVRDQAQRVGLDYFLMVNINNLGNVLLGKETAASADGRRAGDPLANGNTPTAGRDQKGLTAFLNSIVKVDPSCHAGYVHNMKFNKGMFNRERAKYAALLDTYFCRGGTQAMISILNRNDLENAMKEPEKYRNLIVRVGGLSQRFVELDRDIQIDILKRTMY